MSRSDNPISKWIASRWVGVSLLFRRLRWVWGLGLFLLIIGLGHPPGLAEAPVSMAPYSDIQAITSQLKSQVPLPPQSPVTVKVGIFVYDIGEINQVLQKYQLNTVIWLIWQDPRLPFTPEPGEKPEKFIPLTSIWSPDVEVVNSANLELPTDGDVSVEPDGTVTYVRKINLKLSSELNLVRFPFDQQQLKLILESGDYNNKEVVFTVSPRPRQWREEAFISEWSLEDITEEVVTAQPIPDSDDYSQARFAIHIQRRSEFYLWRAFLPLLLIVIVAWLSLWVPLFNVPTGPLPLSIGALLTAITFNFSIGSSLPRVSYLTFFDAFFLICCISIFLTLAVNVYLTKREQEKQMKTQKIRRLGRRLIPASFFVSLLIIILVFLT